MESQQAELSAKHVQAMVGLAGDGKLRDASNASKEFHEFLSHVPSEVLARYASECLGTEKFGEASSALQDLINEVGRRLGFTVENGLYRGKVNDVGHDGLWRSEDEAEFVAWLKRFHITALEDRMYWHVRINGDEAKMTMTVKAGETAPDVTKFLLDNHPGMPIWSSRTHRRS